jgi:uncharacterized small protein (DUF1192 family)
MSYALGVQADSTGECPIGASAAKDVLSRNGLDDRTAAMRSQHADAARLKAQATVRANGRAVTNPHSW